MICPVALSTFPDLEIETKYLEEGNYIFELIVLDKHSVRADTQSISTFVNNTDIPNISIQMVAPELNAVQQVNGQDSIKFRS